MYRKLFSKQNGACYQFVGFSAVRGYVRIESMHTRGTVYTTKPINTIFIHSRVSSKIPFSLRSYYPNRIVFCAFHFIYLWARTLGFKVISLNAMNASYLTWEIDWNWFIFSPLSFSCLSFVQILQTGTIKMEKQHWWCNDDEWTALNATANEMDAEDERKKNGNENEVSLIHRNCGKR